MAHLIKQALTITALTLIAAHAFGEEKPAPTLPVVVAPKTTASSQMSAAQFQQWLQSNGYADPAQTPTTAQTAGQASPQPANTTPPQPAFNPNPGQQSLVNSLPTVQGQADSNLAFNAMLQQNMPLTPQQVIMLRQRIDLAQRAAAVPANIPPKPVSSTLMINLAPGTTPPAIRLATGYVSSLVFVDSTGAPWPIASFDIGNPKAVNMQWDGKGNILMIQASAPYSNGNIVVRLVGLPTPVTLELVTGQPVVDYRADIHVAGFGPNAKDIDVGTDLPANATQLLLGVLDGIAPAGSRQVNVIGADAMAWTLGDKMYLRTHLTVLSPGWFGTMMSPDGTRAYELPKTSTILVSKFGEPAEIKIEGI